MTIEFLRSELEGLRAMGLHRRLRTLDGPVGPRTRLEGRSVLLLCSNAYLGLNTHPEVVRAAADAAREWGTGSGASRLISGTMQLHRDLEKEIARLKGAQDAVLYGSGYQANVGTLTALVGPADLVVADELNHASLIDGLKMSRAKVHTYRHGDASHARELLSRERPRHRRALVLTDGVFSMDGDIAPLGDLAKTAEEHDALLMVDDAHGTGVLGTTGAGTAQHVGLHGRIPIQMGTLSKALASEGGFIAGSSDLCDFLRNRSRAFVFSTALGPPSVAAGLAAIRVLRREPERLETLRRNGQRLRAGLRELGFSIKDLPTPITPVILGPAEGAVRFAAALEEAGVFTPAIRPPTVPDGTSRVRATVMATHTDEDIDEAISAFAHAAVATGVLASAPASS